jgi:uncharacterized protein (TIGR02453 family)
VREFTGFSQQALRFLRDLKQNNDRTWFRARKDIYERELLAPLQALTSDLARAMRTARVPIGVDLRRPTFRIYRDVRFSRDKSPYKTNLGTYLPYKGKREAAGGLYVHVEPKASFMAAGFYQLDKEPLQRWREAMAAKPARFRDVVRALGRNGAGITETEDALKRMPRGFEAHEATPISAFFKYRSFIVSEQLSDVDVADSGLIERSVAFVKSVRPLLNFGWRLLNAASTIPVYPTETIMQTR